MENMNLDKPAIKKPKAKGLMAKPKKRIMANGF